MTTQRSQHYPWTPPASRGSWPWPLTTEDVSSCMSRLSLNAATVTPFGTYVTRSRCQ
jgi:hypothetical protein